MNASVALVLWRRSLNEVLRVRGALLPATIAPVVFLLGMSGQFLLRPPDSAPETHLRVRLALAGAAEGRELRFVDQRMFGGLSVSAGGAELPPEI